MEIKSHEGVSRGGPLETQVSPGATRAAHSTCIPTLPLGKELQTRMLTRTLGIDPICVNKSTYEDIKFFSERIHKKPLMVVTPGKRDWGLGVWKGRLKFCFECFLICVHHFYFWKIFKCHEIAGKKRCLVWSEKIIICLYLIRNLTEMEKMWTGSQDSQFLSYSINKALCHLTRLCWRCQIVFSCVWYFSAFPKSSSPSPGFPSHSEYNPREALCALKFSPQHCHPNRQPGLMLDYSDAGGWY